MLRPNARFCDGCGAPVGSGKPPKKKKTALIISIIALVLVAAIITGTIFIITTVSAKELQEAKDSYEPPAKAVTIDATQKDPSNDEIQFQYDDRDRIITCTYSLKEKEYVQTYDYDDILRLVKIVISYKNHPIFTKEISYDQVEETDTFEEVDGYYVRLDQESKNAGKPEIVDAEPDEALTAFLQFFVNYHDNSTLSDDAPDYLKFQIEYDCRHAVDNSSNIFTSVCTGLSCVNWQDVYPGKGRSMLMQEDATDCPWIEESTFKYGFSFDGPETEWICKNIFNITDEEIDVLYQRAYDDKIIWKKTVGDSYSYCKLEGGKGGYFTRIDYPDVKTDGTYYYVTYTCADAEPGMEANEPWATLFAVMEKKTIDGKDYWSMYYNTANVPDEITPFDLNDKQEKPTEKATESAVDYKTLYTDYLDSNTDHRCGKLFYLNDDAAPELALDVTPMGSTTRAWRICWIKDNKVQTFDFTGMGGAVYTDRSGTLKVIQGTISSRGFEIYNFDGSSFDKEHYGWITGYGTSAQKVTVDEKETTEDEYNTVLGETDGWNNINTDMADASGLPDAIRSFT